jgi:ubiquinone/menaquinone biosynthesis C-methylase UbiE
MSDSFDDVAEAFSRLADKHDEVGRDNPHQTRMRNKVYAHVQRHAPADSRILELNAGTGTDAIELARRGYRVHATDIAAGMLERLIDKVHEHQLGDQVTAQRCSFTDLGGVHGAPFDAIFSNMGGLNCVRDLSPVIRQIPGVLRPGGIVTWVLMPPVCLWEMAEVFRGRVRVAFRRFAPHGTRAHLEGLYFNVYYFTPGQVLRWFGPEFECLSVEGLSVFTPTADSRNFAGRFPGVYRTLSWIDDRLSFRRPWRGWGDFYIISFRFNPK